VVYLLALFRVKNGVRADNGRYSMMTISTEKTVTIGADSGKMRPALSVHTAGKGPAFVLFHGGVGSWTHWVRNIDALAEKFRVVAFDLPGYGASPDVPPELAPDEYIDWVCAAVNQAAPDGCHLAGFSFGGALAARVAARLGGHIKRLSLLGSGGFGVPVGRVIPQVKMPGPEASDHARREVVASNLGQWMLSSAPRIDDPVVDMQLANIERTRFDSRRISLKATMLNDLRAITAPVQMVWGAADKLAYPSIQSRAESCRDVRPDIKIDLVPGGAHWIQYEQAMAVNQLLLEFHGT
jgi:2-hydroxy-6-oxonona-2,4-dienedioate hydrolase